MAFRSSKLSGDEDGGEGACRRLQGLTPISTRKRPRQTTRQTLEIPVWLTGGDEETQGETYCSLGHDSTRLTLDVMDASGNETLTSLAPLERLGPDVSASILQHLSVQEISHCGVVSKSLYQAARNPDLWKDQFQSRWNYCAQDSQMDWFRAYQQAYSNTHDLWITHWNCVDPMDGLGPGRCCIQNGQQAEAESSQNPLCPTCRYAPSLHSSAFTHPGTIATRAQAVAAATRIRLCQHRQHLEQEKQQSDQLFSKYSARLAKRAFSNASTLHRRIATKQYQSNSLQFLSDLLFFQVHEDNDPYQWQDLKHLVPAHATSHHHPHDGSDTALHSWHLCHLSNPDYNRPLVWRISIMRKDCFTVYPSEGHLGPGESRVVVFGVKPLASLLAHATQQLNAHREGVDEAWANVYTEEAHLPPAPFLIHYHFATATPRRRDETNQDTANSPPRGDREDDGTRAVTMAEEQHDRPSQPHFDDAAFARAHPLHPNQHHGHVASGDHSSPFHPSNSPWQRSGKPNQPVRIMCLSAHVNVQHSLAQFRQSTLLPFSILDHRTLAVCAPQLQEFHPAIWNRLEGLTLECEDSIPGQMYRTEAPCQACGQSWGIRLEELGQAFVVAKLESELERAKRNQSFRRMHCLLCQLIQHLHTTGTWTDRHHQICVGLHTQLVDYRGAPWLTQRQREILLQWEVATDQLCLRFNPVDNADTMNQYFVVPWRHAGLYKHVLCTDSAFWEDSTTPLIGTDTMVWKEEPKYLEAFAHLAHSPGRFCLGPQEDPNHLRLKPHHSRYERRQRGCVTDMFFDDPVCGLQAALCVVSDPRSLMVHGIWDRVPYPGTIIRRPKIHRLPLLNIAGLTPRPVTIELSSFIGSHDGLLYNELQDSLDMESLLLIDSWCLESVQCDDRVKLLCPMSLRNYLANVPPPGAGRFPLSKMVPTEDGKGEIEELALASEEEAVPVDATSDSNGRLNGNAADDFNNFHLAALNGRPGPRILSLLWVLSAHLGWTVDDNQGAASVYVDRRILIGAQWLSISLMAAPLFWTLFARYARWIPATPVEYPLQALPFIVENELRFLNERECGYVSLLLLFFWLCLGRWIERYTSRDLLRAMLEHLPSEEYGAIGIIGRCKSKLKLWSQRQWDSVCPLFLQKRIFVPQWNRRSQEDLLKHVAFWRNSQDLTEHSSSFRAVSGGGFVFSEKRNGQIHLGEVSWSTKVIIGTLVSLASFSASSPHFFLNVLTVFSSSISLGLSMSLQSMETGRAGVTVNNAGSMIETLSLVTVVILGFLVGQLVGSSGGVLFLAEFVVTSISLVLGGAGTISASAMESWGTFFCFFVTAFWGYLFGRVSVMEGIRQKRSGFSSIMLCFSLFMLAILWLITIFAWKWESPIELVVQRPLLKSPIQNWGSKYHTARKLQ